MPQQRERKSILKKVNTNTLSIDNKTNPSRSSNRSSSKNVTIFEENAMIDSVMPILPQ